MNFFSSSSRNSRQSSPFTPTKSPPPSPRIPTVDEEQQVSLPSSHGSLHTPASSSSRILNSLGSNLFSHFTTHQSSLTHSSSLSNTSDANPDLPVSQRQSRSSSLASSTLPLTPNSISFIPQQLMSLSGVLNDPKSLKFAKLDLTGSASVPVVPLKRVKLSDFDAYIKSIHGYYDQYADNLNSGFIATGTPTLALKKSPPKFPDPREDPDSPSASLYSLLGLDRLPKSSTASPPKPLMKPPLPDVFNKPLSAVPSVFFEPQFSLENPRIFDLVSESLDVTDIDPALHALATYTDIVEDHLTNEIAARSTSFFSALTNLTDLHQETGACLAQIETLRSRLTQLSAIHATKALETVALTQRRANVAKLLDLVLAMHTVSDSVTTVHSLLHQDDFVAALQVLSECAPAISATSGVVALQVVHTRLLDMGRTLGHLLVDELVKELVQFVLLGSSADVTSPPVDGSVSPSRSTQASRISPLVHCLIRIDALGLALAGYQNKLVNEIRLMIRKLYPPELTVDSRPAPQNGRDVTVSPFIKALKALNLQQFIHLLDSVYEHCTRMMRHLVALHLTVQGAIHEAEQQGIPIGADKHLVGALIPPIDKTLNANDDDEFRSSRTAPDPHLIPPMSPILSTPSQTDSGSTYTQFQTANGRVLSSVMDYAHIRIAKLISSRSDQNAQLSLKDFARLYVSAFEFITAFDTHAVGGNGPVALRTALQTQARAFTVHFHMERMKQLSMLVENETWVQADVLTDFQSIVDRITNLASGGTIDAQRRRQVLALVSETRVDDSISDGLDQKSSSSSTTKPDSSKVLIVGTLQFPVAGVVLMLAKMMDDYLQVVEAIPALATDIHSKIVALLKSFNSRTCQMILGAGAVESAGLKSISAKHLAISSQSLGAVISILPSIRNYLADQMSDKQSIFLNEYSKITKDYTDHQNEVYAKLVAIMQERVTFHSRSLGSVNWEDQHVPHDDKTIPPPTPAMDALVKETITLHRVLTRYLPNETLRMVMGHVFTGFNSRLEVELGKIAVTSAGAKTALLVDIQFFIRKLNALQGVDGPGSHLETVVNEMKITDKESAAAAQRVGGAKKNLLLPSEGVNGTLALKSGLGPADSPTPLSRTPPPTDQPPAATTSSLTGSQSSTNLPQFGSSTPSKFSASISGFNLKSWTTGSVPSGTLPGTESSSVPRAAPPGTSTAPAPVNAQAMTDAALKTKQFASDWMKKMTFMKGGPEHNTS